MRWHWLLIPTVILLSGAAADQKPPRDEDRMQGTWVFATSERDGKKELDGDKVPLEMEFTTETFRFRLPAGAKHAQPYKLDASKKPRTIDWLAGAKTGPAKPLLGIYELDGDTLKICWGKDGKERPQEFKTGSDAGDWLWILKRAKKE